MNWPLSQDYNEALQNPGTSFIDPLLQRGSPIVNSLGLPTPRSGNFADVYPFRDGRGKLWALKCFTRPVHDLHERYAAIDRHLQQFSLPFVVGFRFHQKGIRVRGHWFPLLQMDWIDGLTLDEFITRFGYAHANLESLFLIWVRLCRRLRQADIAHGDLQHANVLLVPSGHPSRLGLKLIDYDGMWVPELGRASPGEIGHPHFQHPTRATGLYGPDIDRFSHLVIATALRALIVGGMNLWQRHRGTDHLIFRQTDFLHPQHSPIIRELWTSDDAILTSLLGHLILSARRPMSETPWLDHLLATANTLALTPSDRAELSRILGFEPPDVLSDTTPAENVFAALRFDDRSADAKPAPPSSLLIWVLALSLLLVGLGLLVLPAVLMISRL